MKKFLLPLIALFLTSTLVFAQEADAPQIDSSTGESTSSLKDKMNTRAGGNIIAEIPAGDLADYLSAAVGAQFVFEADIPLTDSIRFGAAINAAYLYGMTDSDVLDSYSNLRGGIGAFVRIPAGNTFIIQPGIDWNASVQFVSDPDSQLNSPYTDQAISISCGFRFAPLGLCDGKLELNICPEFVMSPEKNYNANFAGIRLGAVYKVKTNAEDEAKRAQAVKEYKAAKEEAAKAKAEAKAAAAEAKPAEDTAEAPAAQ